MFFVFLIAVCFVVAKPETMKASSTSLTSSSTSSLSPFEATEQELKWAHNIKEAALACPDISDATALTDFEYLQHAIVAKDCVDKALERIRRLALFKERYGIQRDGSLEEGLRDLVAFQAAHPGVLLAVEALPDGSFLTACSTGKFFTRDCKSEESIAITMRGFFYVLQACHSNIPALREGMISILDNKGIGWKNINIRIEENVGGLFALIYPAKVNKVVILNSTRTMRWLYKFLQLFLPKKISQRHAFYPDQSSYFEEAKQLGEKVLPAVWGGTVTHDDLQTSLRDKLQARYEMMETFKL